jgi:hypothetical protein
MSSEKTIAQKLLIRGGYTIAVLNLAQPFLLGLIPDDVTVHYQLEGQYDLIVLFVHSIKELDAHAVAAIQAVKPGGLLWFAYPKKTGKIKTDITRDFGWETVEHAGWVGVTQIAIDDTWSALRFRPKDEVGK